MPSGQRFTVKVKVYYHYYYYMYGKSMLQQDTPSSYRYKPHTSFHCGRVSSTINCFLCEKVCADLNTVVYNMKWLQFAYLLSILSKILIRC